ncbi:MAG: HAMP domain-containing sensor histidine kinase [Bacillota bacterium]|nr:HAMP domain-containing sensor histidine kinase [Bacillota bacterium]
MFKKLRFKITLSTLLILLILLIALSTGIYQFAKHEFNKSLDIMLKESAYKVVFSGNFETDYYYKPPFNNRFSLDEKFDSRIKINFFIYNEDLNTEYIKSDDITLINDMKAQAIKALENKEEIYDTISVDGINYRVYSSFFKSFTMVGVIQVYRSIEMQEILLNNLFKILIYSGLIGLLILSAISFFLAGRYIKPVKESWEKQRAFTADASHELRTPLTVIKTNLDAATYDKESKIKENEIWFENIKEEISNLNNLIEELLLLAKNDTVDIKLNATEFNFSKLLNKTLDNFEKRLSEKNIVVEKKIEENLEICADENKIRQLINIILDNAIKYNNKNGSITISLKKERRYVKLMVKDTGIGISKDEIDKVFDRFYRGDKGRNREEGGSGLGLSIAKWIVDKHKGKINIKSEENNGTTINIYLKNN